MQKLDQLEDTIYIDENLSEKVNPIIDRKIDSFVEEIPDKLGPTIANALTKSQDKVVEALFPIIGKMIKKYIQQEIKTLSDNINNQVHDTFSIKKWQRKIKSLFTGISENDIILSELAKPKIQQVFVIEKGSGIIFASYSKTDTIDQDMVAGMLTAIKSFVEDAFHGGNQSLENIEYELYTIHIQNFSSYYIAAVVSGAFDNYFKNKMEDDLMDFADKYIKNDLDNKTLISEKLEEYFKHE